MTEEGKLDTGEKHLLRLVRKGQDGQGWAVVSKVVFPLVELLPSQLVQLERIGDGGRARLTQEGNNILDSMEWL